jgi:predicted permease
MSHARVAGALRDVRYAGRQMRRAPLLTAALLLALAGGTGAAVASLAVVAGGRANPAPGAVPEGIPIPVPALPTLSYSPDPATAPPAGFVPLGSVSDVEQDLPRGIRSVMEESMERLLSTLAGVAAVILGLATATMALLLLSRATARRREMAMRGVLGATPRQLLGQVGAEGAALGVAGLAGGAAVAWGGVTLMRATLPADLAVWLEHPWRAGAIAIGAGIPLAAALVFSAVPALSALGRDLHARVAGGGRATAGPGEGGLRRALTIGGVASSFALLCSAFLLLRGFTGTGAGTDAGFDTSDTLVVQLTAGEGAAAERADVYERLLGRLAAEPGVRAASIASQGAWAGLGTTDVVHAFTGSPTRPGILRSARYHAVSAGYFGALGIPLVGGREFTPEDREGTRAVVVVNEAFAFNLFPFVDPVGKLLQLGGVGLHRTWYTVVGVVRDPRPTGMGATTAPPPAVYLPLLQAPPPDVGLALRTSGNPLDTLPAVRRALHSVAPRATLYGEGTMTERLTALRAPLRWFGVVVAALAGFTTLLAALGLYGVVAHQVERRRRELGIRIALGARGGAVVRMVVMQGVRVTARGLVLGVAGTLCLGRLLQFFFPAIRLGDPLPYAVVGALIVAVSLLASYLPARAAAGVDPALTLRDD